MIKTVRWRPDTCDCGIEYQYDNALADKDKVFSLKTIQKCSSHAGLGNQAAYNQVLKENKAKNYAYNFAKEANPDLMPEDMSWSFNSKRVITVNFLSSKVTGAQISQIQKSLNNKIGTGVVAVATKAVV